MSFTVSLKKKQDFSGYESKRDDDDFPSTQRQRDEQDIFSPSHYTPRSFPLDTWRPREISQTIPTTPSPLSGAQREKICKVFSLVSTSLQQDYFQAAFEACKNKQWSLIEPIKDDLDHLVNQQGRTLLLEALDQKDVSLSIELIKQKISLLKTDKAGNNALHYAAGLGDTQLVRVCWEHLAINAPNFEGWTPLHQAVESCNLRTIIDLLANGASINARACYHHGEKVFQVTPFQLAIIKGHRNCIGRMLSYDPDLKLQVNGIGTLIHLAIHFYQERLLEDLLTLHFEKTKEWIDTPNDRDMTPTMLAAFLGEAKAIALLKEKGALLETRDPSGRTAFHWAALGRQRLTIDLLYHYECKVDLLDGNRKTADQLIASSPDTLSQSLANHIVNLSLQRERLSELPPIFTYELPENLVFKGGGPKGFAYLGAYRELEKRGVLREVKRVAGTSAGAITATLIAMGYTPDELESILTKEGFSFSSFIDHPFAAQQLSEVKEFSFLEVIKQLGSGLFWKLKHPFSTLWDKAGVCPGEVFRKWIEDLIFQKTGVPLCTFGELKALIDKGALFKQLYLYTCNILTQKPTQIDSETDTWKDVVISDAVRASISIPAVFRSHILHTKDAAGNRVPLAHLGVHIDGGLIRNYPIDTFDKRKYLPTSSERERGEWHLLNRRTLGFTLFSPKTEAPEPDQSVDVTVRKFLSSLTSIYRHAEESLTDQIYDNQFRTIRINNQGIGLLEFELSKEKQQLLIQSGQTATSTFCDEQERLTSSQISLFIHPRITLGGKKIKESYYYFTGREKYIRALERKFFVKKETIVVLTGAPGMGKTETAIIFARRHLARFSLVWSIDSETEEKMKESYRELAKELSLHCEEKDSFASIRSRVHANLETSPRSFLLIYDSVESNISLPTIKEGSAILITSRQKQFWDEGRLLPMILFSKKEALETFSRIVKMPVNKTMEDIVEKLGYFPLAITQVAFYVARTPGVTLDQCLTSLKEHEKTVVTMEMHEERYPHSFINAWRITEATLKRDYPLALKWLQLCSCLEPDHIPTSWIDRWLERIEPDMGQRLLKRNEILFALNNYVMMSYHASSQTLSLHRSRQLVIFNSLNEEAQKQIQAEATDLIDCIGKELNVGKLEDWDPLAIWKPHALKILNFNQITPLQKGDIFYQLSAWEYRRGRYVEASQYAHKAVEICRSNYNKEPSERLSFTLNHLGSTLNILGERQDAKKFIEEGLAMNRVIYKTTPNHPTIAGSLDTLGGVLNDLGDLQGAKKSHEEALAMYRVTYKDTPNQPNIAGSLNNLGIVLHTLKDLQGAKKSLEEALAMHRVIYKDTPNHHNIANSLNNLGLVLHTLKDLQGAKKSLEEALAMYRVIYKDTPNHPDIVISLYNLGLVLYDLGDFQGAKKYLEEALAMERIVYKDTPNHPDIAHSLTSLAYVLYALKDLTGAISHCRQALGILQQVMGENHPQTLSAKSRLGSLYRIQEIGTPCIIS